MSTEKYLSTEKYFKGISQQAAKLNQLIEKTIELRIAEKIQNLQWIPNEQEYLEQLLSEESIAKFVTDEGEWFTEHFEKDIYNKAYKTAPEENYFRTLQYSRLRYSRKIKKKLKKMM